MISSASDSSVDFVCDVDGEEFSKDFADLVAGYGKNTDAIIVECPTGHRANYARAWGNFDKHHGLINGLHRALVDANQIAADSSAVLLAEGDGDKPDFYYAISSTPVTHQLGSDGKWPTDLARVLALYGISQCREFLRSGGIFYTNDSDDAIGTFLSALFPSSEAERTLYGAALRLDKALRF